MIGYWFKPSILLFFIPFISLAQVNNTNIYTLDLTSSNINLKYFYIEKTPIQIEKIQNCNARLDITALVNLTNTPHFPVEFGYEEKQVGRFLINFKIYKNKNLITEYGYQNNAVYKNTNTYRTINILLIDR